MQSTAERPGKRNTGRMILVIKVPINSNRPKFSSSGNSNPANTKTQSNTGSRSFNTNAPVAGLVINAGPWPDSTNSKKIAPSTRTTTQPQPGLNNLPAKLLDGTWTDFASLTTKVRTADTVTINASKYGIQLPSVILS